MLKYMVQDGEKFYNGKAYQPGDIIECTEAEAKQMRLSLVPQSEGEDSTGGGEKKGKKDK